MVVLCLSRFLAVPAVFGLVNCESDCEDTLSCGSTPGDAPNAGGTSGRGGADAGGSAGRGDAGSGGSGGASGTSSGSGGSASGSGGSSSERPGKAVRAATAARAVAERAARRSGSPTSARRRLESPVAWRWRSPQRQAAPTVWE
jgi:hypothetical protein